MIVVDTNVLCYLFLDSERTGQAEQALARDAEWAAPPLWRSELRNVLSVAVRRGDLGLADARRIAEEAERLMAGGEYQAESGAVLALAADSGCSAYDCEFVAVARSLGATLVTVDRQVLAAFPQMAVPLADYAGS